MSNKETIITLCFLYSVALFMCFAMVYAGKVVLFSNNDVWGLCPIIAGVIGFVLISWGIWRGKFWQIKEDENKTETGGQ